MPGADVPSMGRLEEESGHNSQFLCIFSLGSAEFWQSRQTQGLQGGWTDPQLFLFVFLPVLNGQQRQAFEQDRAVHSAARTQGANVVTGCFLMRGMRNANVATAEMVSLFAVSRNQRESNATGAMSLDPQHHWRQSLFRIPMRLGPGLVVVFCCRPVGLGPGLSDDRVDLFLYFSS